MSGRLTIACNDLPGPETNSSGIIHVPVFRKVTLVKPGKSTVIGESSWNTITGSTPTVWPWPRVTRPQGRDHWPLSCLFDVLFQLQDRQLYSNFDLWPWANFTSPMANFNVVTLISDLDPASPVQTVPTWSRTSFHHLDN